MSGSRKERRNCWEFRNCGREPGGAHVHDLGVCPAAVAVGSDGINRGSNAGRYCWRIAGTLCSGEIHGSFAEKVCDCGRCAFFLAVVKEEGKRFTP